MFNVIKPTATDLFSYKGEQPAVLASYLLVYTIPELARMGYTGPINPPPPYDPTQQTAVWDPETNTWKLIDF